MREMKLPTVAEIRVPLLAALIATEIGGIAHFYGSRSFLSFLYLCIVGAAITGMLLWIEKIEKIGVSRDDLALYYFFIIPSPGSRLGTTFFRFAFGVVFSMVVGFLILQFTGGKGSIEGPGSTNAGRIHFGPLIAVFVLLFSCSCGVMFASDNCPSMIWSFPLFPPLFWFVGQYILYRIDKKKINPNENLSILQ
jgi:hypothetical protein